MEYSAATELGTTLPGGGVWVASHRHGPGFRTDTHAHRHPLLLYIAAGQGAAMLDGRRCPLAADTALLLPAGQRHQLTDRPGKPMTVFVVHFAADAVAVPAEEMDALLQAPRVIAVPPHRVSACRRGLRRLLHEQAGRDRLYVAVLRNVLTGLLLELARLADAADAAPVAAAAPDSLARVRNVLAYVAENHFLPQSLPEAARMAHLSQRRFSTLCRRATGQSFTAWVNRHRVEHARRLLEQSEAGVAAVAFEVGFEDLSTFYRAFRKVFAAAPQTFRAAGT